jgi:hypothetical protein
LACNTYRGEGRCIQGLGGRNIRGEDHLQNIGVDGSVILNLSGAIPVVYVLNRMMEIHRTQLCLLYSFIQATCFDPLKGSSSGHRSIYKKSYGLRLPAGIPFGIVYLVHCGGMYETGYLVMLNWLTLWRRNFLLNFSTLCI